MNCFALNFNWPDELTIPSISISLNSKLNVGLAIRKSSPSNCYIVLVGGKVLHRMKDIVQKVQEVSEVLVVKFLYYFAEKIGTMPEVESKSSPVMVW